MRFSVIGAGVIGKLRAQTVLDRGDLELAWVADLDQEAARAATGRSEAGVFADYREALGQDAPEAVIISGPCHLHEEMILAAFAAGAHVLVEKPLAPGVEACRRILEAARAAGRSLGVGFNHRFYPSIRFVKEVLDSGRLGRIDHFRIFGGHDGLANFRADWMYKSELSGGGALMDCGIHMTDLARYLGGEIRSVYGVATGEVWKVPGSEDNAMAIFETTAGVPMSYHATWTEWKGYRFYVEAYGERGMVRGYYAPMFNLLVERDPTNGARKKTRRFYPEIILREKLRGWQTTTLGTFQAELADFLGMIAGREVDLADGLSGLRAVEIAAAVKQSRAEKRLIEFPEAAARP